MHENLFSSTLLLICIVQYHGGIGIKNNTLHLTMMISLTELLIQILQVDFFTFP